MDSSISKVYRVDEVTNNVNSESRPTMPLSANEIDNIHSRNVSYQFVKND